MASDELPGDVRRARRAGMNRLIVEESLEVGPEGIGGGIPILAILRDRLHDDAIEILGDVPAG
ncbi:MAG: hypothetical protein KDA25_12185, partial [Phycisphaerales bacterium]|nr:hypothetical protein [Phycisphaerales bacterium]